MIKNHDSQLLEGFDFPFIGIECGECGAILPEDNGGECSRCKIAEFVESLDPEELSILKDYVK